jgi:hypothetical protein
MAGAAQLLLLCSFAITAVVALISDRQLAESDRSRWEDFSTS